MIGQTHLSNLLKTQIADNTFSHFCILTGPEGSGRKTLAREIGSIIKNSIVLEVGISVSDIRSMIENAYKMVNTTVHIIPDADRMSLPAKNALLKVTEEPPNNAYFIMTLRDVSNTLDTIKSRASVYRMDNYSRSEIDSYCLSCGQSLDEENKRIINNLCETPGEVNYMLNIGATEFYDFVSYVVDYIAETSGSNSFKIANKIALKADSEGYDLRMFLKLFMSICIERMETDSLRYIKGEAITSKYLRELNITGVNKQMLFDSWLLAIRENWIN